MPLAPVVLPTVEAYSHNASDATVQVFVAGANTAGQLAVLDTEPRVLAVTISHSFRFHRSHTCFFFLLFFFVIAFL